MSQSADGRTLGRGGPHVSALGLGMAALGRPGYMVLGHADDFRGATSVQAMRERAHQVLDAAWALGVRYFDAARSYGRAEEFLAGWLQARGVAPGEVTVASKWGYTYTAGWQTRAAVHEVKDHGVDQLRRQWPESRALLGPWLRVYQIHSATLETGVLDDPAVLGRLAELKAEGITIGLSLTGPRQADTLARALEREEDGVRLFGAVQATWNLLERSAGDALAAAHGEGVGVVLKEVLANGRLTARNRDPAFALPGGALDGVATRLGATPDAVALAAALARPWADVVLSGAATVAQLQSNAEALSLAWDERAEAELRGLGLDAERYWSERSQLPWS